MKSYIQGFFNGGALVVMFFIFIGADNQDIELVMESQVEINNKLVKLEKRINRLDKFGDEFSKTINQLSETINTLTYNSDLINSHIITNRKLVNKNQDKISAVLIKMGKINITLNQLTNNQQ